MFIIGLFLCLFAVLLAYIAVCFRFVKKPFHWVIEKNFPPGSPTIFKVWKEGIHFLWFPIAPFMYVREKVPMNDYPIELKIGQAEGDGLPSKVELDDCAVEIVAQVVIRVIDPIKATYNVENLRRSVINKAESLIRQALGGEKFDNAVKENTKKEVIDKLSKESKEVFDNWGVKLVDASILDFVLEEKDADARREILAATKKKESNIITAEGQRQVTVLEAEGKKKAIILEAEGRKVADILEGTGQAGKIKEIANIAGIDPVQVMAYLVSGNYFASLEKATIIATSGDGKLNFPVDIAAAIMGLMKAMGKGGSTT